MVTAANAACAARGCGSVGNPECALWAMVSRCTAGHAAPADTAAAAAIAAGHSSSGAAVAGAPPWESTAVGLTARPLSLAVLAGVSRVGEPPVTMLCSCLSRALPLPPVGGPSAPGSAPMVAAVPPHRLPSPRAAADGCCAGSSSAAGGDWDGLSFVMVV